MVLYCSCLQLFSKSKGKDRIFQRISLPLRECKHLNMARKTINILTLFMLAVILCMTGCKSVKDIKITSVEFESATLNGFKSIDVFLKVGVENPAKQVRLSEIDGSLIHSGKVIGKLAMDPFILGARTSDIYTLKAKVSLAQGAGLKDLMILTGEKGIYECTIDVSAKAAYGKAAPVSVKKKNIPLKKLLDTFENEKN